jgi:hypothetical protein
VVVSVEYAAVQVAGDGKGWAAVVRHRATLDVAELGVSGCCSGLERKSAQSTWQEVGGKQRRRSAMTEGEGLTSGAKAARAGL